MKESKAPEFHSKPSMTAMLTHSVPRRISIWFIYTIIGVEGVPPQSTPHSSRYVEDGTTASSLCEFFHPQSARNVVDSNNKHEFSMDLLAANNETVIFMESFHLQIGHQHPVRGTNPIDFRHQSPTTTFSDILHRQPFHHNLVESTSLELRGSDSSRYSMSIVCARPFPLFSSLCIIPSKESISSHHVFPVATTETNVGVLLTTNHSQDQ